jgi:hypothetical protein
MQGSVTKLYMGEGLPKCQVTIFLNFEPYFCILIGCQRLLRALCLKKKFNVTSHGGSEQSYKMTHGEGGGLKSAKQCHVLFEWPFFINFIINVLLVLRMH